jgi:hypothetical protein
MRQSLSRIEYEYVLQTLRESLPALSAISPGFTLAIPQKTYTVNGNRIYITSAIAIPEHASSVRFFFKHKLRGFYFDAPVIANAGAGFSFEIAREIFKDDRDGPSGEQGWLDVALGLVNCRSLALSKFPLDSVLVDPDVLSDKQARLQVLAERCGVLQENVLLSFRLYEYLAALSSGDVSVPEPKSGHLLFVDHGHALTCIALSYDMTAKYLHSELQTDICVDARRIHTVATLCGCLKISPGLTAICLDITSAAPEDKRFLYERLYREKYRGE